MNNFPQMGPCDSKTTRILYWWVVSRVGCRELEGGGDKAGQGGGGSESLVSGLIVLSLKLTVCCSKRADATADLSGAIEAGNKEDSEKYSKRTVMLHSTPFFSDGRSWESQFGDFFFELVFVSSHLSCGQWRVSLWEVTSLAEIPAILGLFCRLKMKSLNLAIVLGRGRGSGIDNGAGGCSYSRSVTTLKEAGYEEDVLVEMEPS
ncbi:hypothetical protein F2Q69_00061671 [Brassica cretica]|uniref:Uncharacterized protein n=1 Tax=Brassica cretica TaxID=69181 RepID=A0A8S9RQL9_BRACR|nr:hypothetical protein F2Q69_00061671 [Brassica cretica]